MKNIIFTLLDRLCAIRAKEFRIPALPDVVRFSFCIDVLRWGSLGVCDPNSVCVAMHSTLYI